MKKFKLVKLVNKNKFIKKNWQFNRLFRCPNNDHSTKITEKIFIEFFHKNKYII